MLTLPACPPRPQQVRPLLVRRPEKTDSHVSPAFNLTLPVSLPALRSSMILGNQVFLALILTPHIPLAPLRPTKPMISGNRVFVALILTPHVHTPGPLALNL